MTDFPLKFGEQAFTVPAWWFDAVLLLVTLVGLMLWLFGKRLVKPTFSGMGMVIGLVIVWLALRLNFPEVATLPWLVAGGIIGLMVGLLLWRFGMAMIFMLAVVVAAPAVVMTFQEIGDPEAGGPEIVEPFVYQFGESKKIVLDFVAQNADNEDESLDTSQLLSLTEPLKLAQTEAWENGRVWWQGLPSGQQLMLFGASVGGGIVAFIFGIALPGVAGSLVTSLLGVMMMMTGVMRLADGVLPEGLVGLLPHEPRSIMLAIGVGMVIGALLQWTFFRKSADKSE